MKHLNMVGLPLVVAALVALTATASATTVTTTTGGSASTPLIHAVNEGWHVTLANSIANIECGATVEGWVESHGSGAPASGQLSNAGGSSCTNSWSAAAIKLGSFSITYTSGHNGTVSSSGGKVETSRFGVVCNYETNNTKIGTVTGGWPATLHFEASIPIGFGSSFLCGSGSAKLEGSLVTTGALYIAP